MPPTNDILTTVSRGFCHWTIVYDAGDDFRVCRWPATLFVEDTTGEALLDVVDHAVLHADDASTHAGKPVTAFFITKKWCKSKHYARVAYCDLDKNNFLKVPKKGFGRGYEDGSVFVRCQVEFDNFYKIMNPQNDEIIKKCYSLAEAKLDARVISGRIQKKLVVEQVQSECKK